jgi:predicted ATP-dependent endonuclease of OLD family
MKLIRVALKQFRCYNDAVSIDISDITALIGRNDAGKSAILDALDIFFENAKLETDDANKDSDKRDVRIICEFSDLPETILLDATNPSTLAEEHLLNTNRHLEIHKVYDGNLKTP